MTYLVDWEMAVALGPAAVGGKGWNLGRLHRYGFAVPAGGVVVADAYRLFLRENGLEPRVASLSTLRAGEVTDPAAARGLDEMTEAIRAARLPEALAADLERFLASPGLAGRPVAVRSSATAEDSAAASFAGIHHSFLNVTGLPAVAAALRGCYASLWTPQAVAYRRRLGLSDREVAAAVVILVMVPARAAGVAFSADPRTGNRSQMILNATLGLGELLVSGAVEPDAYRLEQGDFPLIVERRIGNKQRIARPGSGGGTEWVELPAEERHRPALTDAQVEQLAHLVLRVQDALGEDDLPQDVEWAWDGEQFVLLQARPLTHLPEPGFPGIAGQPVIWSNANLKEVMPGVPTPFNWTTVRPAIDTLLSASFRRGGYPLPPGLRWVRLYQGRPYFNLSALQWAVYDGFGTRPEEMNRHLGGYQPTIAGVPAGSPFRGLAGLRRLARTLRLVIPVLRLNRQAPEEFRRHWRWAESQEARDFRQFSHRELVGLLQELKRRIHGFLPRVSLINGSFSSTHQQLESALERRFPDRGTALANALLAGSEGVTSAEQGYRLLALGRVAGEEPQAQAFFAAADSDLRGWRQALAGTRFVPEFEQFLRDYGHRAICEIEISHPRWREDPSYLLEVVRAHVRANGAVRPQPAEEKRRAAEAELDSLGRLPRSNLHAITRRAREAARLREMAKSVMVKLGGVSRLLALEIGRRLVREGRLEAPEEIFYISRADLEALLSGTWDGRGIQALVADRQARREALRGLNPPDVMLDDTPQPCAAAPAAHSPLLTGIGVASGQASGRARLIHHPAEGHRLEPGEVLVAPSTDPAWTPLFLRASALVMEVGGYLSHGAIVAREYGIPAVVNIPGVLGAVVDGQLLTVDGDAGKVYPGRIE
ncbi:MAG: pyruvate, phosphate dikinase [Candidatus Tectomicrobia bacterium]|uniref:Pyruvate, phosphate dikinase n=1 Tax=Tectimicrobiota bacterium TaxID=2528274 RepID=A0A932FX69_UNCTE|nr:pyruvate, phosphate dikinase [Candidatus Tectomicrobia bacterium]